MTEIDTASAVPPRDGTGEEIAFVANGHRCAFTLEPAGNEAIPSIFLVSLPKAGSTLLNRIMRPLVRAAGLTYVGLVGAANQMGVAPEDIPAELNRAFRPKGYAFGGFRTVPDALALPPYASERTVLLIRDPRDMLTSLYFSVAFSHRPPGQGAGGTLAAAFDEARREARRTSIDAFVLARTGTVSDQYRDIERKLSSIRHKLYRYEDVVFDKRAWTRDMLGYLGLDIRPALIERVVAQNDVRPAGEDLTQHVRKVVPGDHADKLRPETIAELNASLDPILRRYGYA